MNKIVHKTIANKEKGSEGFTLTELLIVIVVIAILVAIAVPVYLNSTKKADQATAEYNLKEGGHIMDRVWFKILDRGEAPDGINTYRDWDPPEPLKSTPEYQANGWVPVNARYLSLLETRITWADLDVGGGSGGAAEGGLAPDFAPAVLAQSGGYGFVLTGIYRDGETLYSGPDIANSWNLLPGKIAVVTSMYYWDNGWKENVDNTWITLITLEHSGVAHYLTLKAGQIMDYGYFNWNDGQGNPGEGWKDDDHGDVVEKPDDDENPTNPPANEPNPGNVQPPAPEPPKEPPATEPTEPEPGDENPPAPEQPPVEPKKPYEFVSSCEIKPETLNLDSNGIFTVFIEFAEGYDASVVDLSTVRCSGAIAVDIKEDGNGRAIIEFDRESLLQVEPGDDVVLAVNGKFIDGQEFVGYDMVKVITNQSSK